MLDPDNPGRFSHERIDELIQNPLRADPGATYAKTLYLNLSVSTVLCEGNSN